MRGQQIRIINGVSRNEGCNKWHGLSAVIKLNRNPRAHEGKSLCSFFFYKKGLLSTHQSATEAPTVFSRLPSLMAVYNLQAMPLLQLSLVSHPL